VKIFSRLLILAIWVLVGRSYSQTPPHVDRFAVEIPQPQGLPPTYATIRSTGTTSSLFYDGSLRWKTGADPNRPRPTALKLEYSVKGELVLIKASVYFGDFDRQKTPASLYNLPSEGAGSYHAGLGQAVTLFDLEKFGLEPITLRVVSAEPLPSLRPQTMSKVPSVQIEITGEDRTFYKVAVQNLSTKGVTAFSVSMPANGDSNIQRVGGAGKVLIPPGGKYELNFGIPHSGRMRDGKFVEDPPRKLMILETATFTDGSYEGGQ
jgi:hypothetical protein